MVYGTYNYSYWGLYINQLTYNVWGPHSLVMFSPVVMILCVSGEMKPEMIKNWDPSWRDTPVDGLALWPRLHETDAIAKKRRLMPEKIAPWVQVDWI